MMDNKKMFKYSEVKNITPLCYNEEDILKHIERCGRVCWRSEDKCTNESYKKFTDMIKNKEHLSVFEHGTIYIRTDKSNVTNKLYAYNEIVPHIIDFKTNRGTISISTNKRFVLEKERLFKGLFNDLNYIEYISSFDDVPDEIKRYSFLVDTSINVTRELNRHRILSVSEMSTRYINLTKKEMMLFLNVIDSDDEKKNLEEKYIKSHLVNVAYLYKILKDSGRYKSQELKRILPLDLMTQVVYTSNIKGWEHIFKLRCNTSAYPECRKVAEIIRKKINSTYNYA